MKCIEVHKVSKKYSITHQRSGNQSFRGALFEGVKNLFGTMKDHRDRRKKEEFYALRDISFELEQGDIVGIIGKNGSGKSTLLKILSRITHPSSGTVSLNGRVASLLEVGTGFHGELTGRENIFMNGVVLGMSRRDIIKKFDEIVAFAEVAHFLDTPVKRYSSGMLLRLAFAVAAHLDPEILIIDEILTVGDIEFQKKCLKVMDNLGTAGRTVLFVSHNIGAVRRLCKKGIFLSGGVLQKKGDIQTVVDAYLMHGRALRSAVQWGVDDAPQDFLVRLRSVRACNGLGINKEVFSLHEAVYIDIEYELKEKSSRMFVSLQFYNFEGALLFVTNDSAMSTWNDLERDSGYYKSRCFIPSDFLNNGDISVTISFFVSGVARWLHEENAISFTIVDDMNIGGARGAYAWEWPATAVRPLLEWKSDYYGK